MTDHTDVQGLNQAVQRYFDLMYNSDTSHFDRVFRSTAQLHGFRGAKCRVLSAQAIQGGDRQTAIAEVEEHRRARSKS